MAQHTTTDSTVLELAHTSDRKKTPTLRRFRYMTPAEAMRLGYGDHIYFQTVDGRHWGEMKVNGQVRTWKRDPERFELPLKYGMRDYTTYTPNTWYAPNNDRRQTIVGNGQSYAIVPLDD